MIQTRQFSQFLHNTIDIQNNETKEKTMWEFWLHRVFDQEFGDFYTSGTVTKSHEASSNELIDAVSFTMSMSGFDPGEDENL